MRLFHPFKDLLTVAIILLEVQGNCQAVQSSYDFIIIGGMPS